MTYHVTLIYVTKISNWLRKVTLWLFNIAMENGPNRNRWFTYENSRVDLSMAMLTRWYRNRVTDLWLIKSVTSVSSWVIWVIVGGENSHQLHLQGATELQDLATFHRIHSHLRRSSWDWFRENVLAGKLKAIDKTWEKHGKNMVSPVGLPQKKGSRSETHKLTMNRPLWIDHLLLQNVFVYVC